jgi:hypothetical protein
MGKLFNDENFTTSEIVSSSTEFLKKSVGKVLIDFNILAPKTKDHPMYPLLFNEVTNVRDEILGKGVDPNSKQHFKDYVFIVNDNNIVAGDTMLGEEQFHMVQSQEDIKKTLCVEGGLSISCFMVAAEVTANYSTETAQSKNSTSFLYYKYFVSGVKYIRPLQTDLSMYLIFQFLL